MITYEYSLTVLMLLTSVYIETTKINTEQYNHLWLIEYSQGNTVGYDNSLYTNRPHLFCSRLLSFENVNSQNGFFDLYINSNTVYIYKHIIYIAYFIFSYMLLNVPNLAISFCICADVFFFSIFNMNLRWDRYPKMSMLSLFWLFFLYKYSV